MPLSTLHSARPVDWPAYQASEAMAGSFPVCLPTDFSPLDDAFSYHDPLDKACLVDAFSAQQDYSLDDWVMPDHYDRPVSSVEPFASALGRPAHAAAMHPPMAAFIASRPAPPANPPFGALPRLDAAFDFSNPARTASFASSGQPSPRDLGSPTPSLCEDGATSVPFEASLSPATHQHQHQHQHQHHLDRKPIKRAPSASEEEHAEPAAKRMPRKRGRPRLNHSDTDPANDCSSSAAASSAAANAAKPRCNRRLPHNQVERKYREGLNAELERLRRAVPTLPQRDSNDLSGPPKPSKATVLASAIDYIKFIEADRERLLEEVERLRGIRPMRAPNAKLRGYGWSKPRSDSSSSPLSSSDE